MNILLVIFNKDIENPDVFKDRIKTLGEIFYVFDNMVLVETDNSTKEAYEKLSIDAYEKSSMLILYIRNEMLGFWGRMNTQLWSWLEDREEKTKDGLILNYIAEIYKKDLQIKQQTELIEKLKSENENYQKSIANLYQQTALLEKKVKERND